MNRILAAALAALSFAPALAGATRPPMYLIVDFKPVKVLPGNPPPRRTVTIRAYDDGDPGACARGQMHYPNRAGSPQVSSCVRELPPEFAAVLQDGGMPQAYVLKYTDPRAPGAMYELMYDMSTTNPTQTCRNIVDYKQRFGGLSTTTRVKCWVPRS